MPQELISNFPIKSEAPPLIGRFIQLELFSG
jgi:hypothetical protein